MSAPDLFGYDASVAASLLAVQRHDGPLLLDLDETLYLRNSTEDFLDCARPGTLALILLRLLDALKPWRWSGGIATRDVWRVQLILRLLPWTLRRWRARVPALAAAHANQPLLAALAERWPDAVVVTAGFEPIVVPLLQAMGLGDVAHIASSVGRFSDRRDGKLPRVMARLGYDAVRNSLVLTDSIDDAPLLAACARPLLTVWPQAQFRSALGHVYLPGQYLALVKRPGERYIVRGILQEDYAFWVIASIALSPAPLLHIVGLAVLLLSFWAIYEAGYVDNDSIAARHEAKPTLSAAFHRAPVATPALAPWIWAAVSGLAGIALLRWPAPPSALDLAMWMLVLAATSLCFRVYNRCDKATRIWLYPGLQLARSVAFVAIVPVTLPGSIALGAHVLARWLPYVVYRSGDSLWPEMPCHLIRLMFFAMLSLLLTLAIGPQPFMNATMAALLLWNLFRARGELAAVWRNAGHIERSRA